jgi:4,5-DOPA dioxygenase extradiol
MPLLFVGHGSPMNAIEDNRWSRAFRDLAKLLPTPKAIVCVSAHWYVRGTRVMDNSKPKTIHDFGGFPQALFDMQYPAPGDAALASRIVGLLGKERAQLDGSWGLDHGTWSVLHHLRPDADAPVLQVSLDGALPPEGHLELGRALAPLRDEGVTHNLRLAMRALQTGDATTPEWARRFDDDVTRALEQHDGAFLARVVGSDDGRMAHPTPDHYLPLLYTAGAADARDTIRFPITGWDGGSLSMRAVVYG